MELFPENTTTTGISSPNTAIHAATDLITELKNTPPYAPFKPLGTEKLNSLRKLVEIIQGQITPKTKLDTTETQTKIVEQNQNITQLPPIVEQQAVTIPSSPTT